MKTQEAEFLDAAEKRFQLFGDDLVHQAFFGMSRSIVLRCRLHILPDKQGLGQMKSLNHKRFSGPSANCGTMLYGRAYARISAPAFPWPLTAMRMYCLPLCI